VADISDTLRGLTNSGYKFKCGNVPDRISELTDLRVRRDRLREAFAIVTSGIEFETELGKLRAIATPGGNPETVCTTFQKVLFASAALESIPKFQSHIRHLQEIQKMIEGLIRPELSAACAQRNSVHFSTYAGYCRQISCDFLPAHIALTHFRDEANRKVVLLAGGELPVTDWLPECFAQCRELTVGFSQWCLAFSPSIFQPSLRIDLVRIVSDVLGREIDAKIQGLVSSNDFVALASVMTAIRGFVASFPPEWRLPPNLLLDGCVKAIQATFPEMLQTYLATLVRKSPRSPQKTPPTFDQGRLEKLITLGMNAAGWSHILAVDAAPCYNFISTFLVNAIESATAEREAFVATQKVDDKMHEIHLAEVAKYYIAQREVEQRIIQFEKESPELISSPSSSFSKFKDSIEWEIVTVMASRTL
jgi:hypothetical protein